MRWDCVFSGHPSVYASNISVMENINNLTKINLARSQDKEHFLQSGNLLLRKMSAVIDQNVNSTNLISKVFPKGAICLIAYEDSRPLVFIGFACGLNVDSINMASRPKILLPHVETSAAKYTNFNHVPL